jgi:molybdopterin converting factor small subunit
MRITLEYHGQLRHLAQAESESREVDDGTSIPELVSAVAGDYDELFRAILLDASGALTPSALILMGDDPVDRENWPVLKDGDVITLLPPIAGG